MAISNFKIGDKVVYPSHGIGEIIGEEAQTIGGVSIDVFVIMLIKEKMTLRVPTRRATSIGLRHLVSQEIVEEIMRKLQDKPKTTKGMWSRRVQEYETKINSGDLILISEVIRDLHSNVNDPDRSYSERVIYDLAMDRLLQEISAIRSTDITQTSEVILAVLNEKEHAA